MKVVHLLILCVLPMLIGCIADQNSKANNTANQNGATVAVERSKVDAEDVANKVTEKVSGKVQESINASTTNTQASMQGLINLGVSKLADTFKAVEANLSDLIKISVTNQMTANANLQNDMQATITATNRVEARLEANLLIQNTMRAEIKNDMRAYMDAKFDAQAQAQLGAFNKSTQEIVTATAGRDVNYLPKEAVYLVLSFIIVIGILGGIIAYFLFKQAMAETKNERDEKMRIYNILNNVLPHVPDDKAATVRDLVTRGLPLPPADPMA